MEASTTANGLEFKVRLPILNSIREYEAEYQDGGAPYGGNFVPDCVGMRKQVTFFDKRRPQSIARTARDNCCYETNCRRNSFPPSGTSQDREKAGKKSVLRSIHHQNHITAS
jgi:hypothetical protein